MVYQSINPSEKKSRIEAALQEYLERIDRGEAIDQAQFLSKYADVAENVQSFIANAEDMSRWAHEERASDSTQSEAREGTQTVHPVKASARKASLESLPVDLDRYHVQDLLGRGAMGAVYLAVDRQLNRRVAFKVPSFDAEESAELLARFYHEARAAAHLQHPNICPVYDVGKIDGQHYIAMAYINGKTLSQHIKSDSPPNERQSLIIIRKLATALHEAHRQGVIHRDLKPANIMIARRGEPIVMDFGLACRVESEGTARLTHEGVLIGSPAYMSPEQVEGKPERISQATDQYSLGVILYEMLTGQLPFRGSLTVVIAQVMQKAPTPPHEIRADIDPRAEALCLKMMSKSAADRYPTLEAVATAILKILREPKPDLIDTKPATAAGVTVISSNAERQQLIQTLLREGDLAGAKDLLEAMAALKDTRSQKAVKWANQLLHQLKREAQHWQVTVPELQKQARAHLQSYEYREAVKLLESIPASYRSKVIVDLLEDASAKQSELELLQADLVKAIRKSQSRELPGLVKQYLKLNPVHRGIKQLAAEIKQLGPERAIQVRRGRKDVLAVSASWLQPRYLLLAAGFAMVAVTCAIILLPTSRGTVILEVHDPNVTLTFGDDEITVTKSGQRYQLKPTEKRTLQVRIEGVLLDATTQEITVAKNETKLITARLLPNDQVELTVDGKPRTLSFNPDVMKTPSESPAVAQTDREHPKNELRQSISPIAAPAVYSNSIGMKLVLIPKGRSWLGGGGNKLGEREVQFDSDFYLGKYEVTQEEWGRMTGMNPSSFSRQGAGKGSVQDVSDADLLRFPVESISWDAIQGFLNDLNKKTAEPGWIYRLPTADEWEYACRGGPMSDRINSAYHYYFSEPTNQLSPHQANYDKSPNRPTKVGSYPPNRLGLHDMHGNLFEWCNDPQETPNGILRVNVGGGWVTFTGKGPLHKSGLLIAAFRNSVPTSPSTNVGFRVARVRADSRKSLPSAQRDNSPPEVRTKSIATLPQAPGLPLRWLSCSIHVPSAFDQAASLSNLVQDRSWPKHGDTVIQQARQHNVRLLLAFEPSDFPEFLTSDHPAFENTLFELIQKNRDVVVGVNLLAPYTNDDLRGIDRIGPFGRRLKSACPELSYWVTYQDSPKNWTQALPPIPPEVDVVEMAMLSADSIDSVVKRFEQHLSTWQQLAGSRPLLVRWVSSYSAEAVPKKGPLITEPGTIIKCLRLGIEHGLAGVAFSHLGSRPDGWGPAINSDPHALRELQEFSDQYGYGARTLPQEQAASPIMSPTSTPSAPAVPSMVVPPSNTESGADLGIKKRAKLPTGAGLPFKWLAFSVQDPKSFDGAAETANLIFDNSWQRHGDTLLQQARRQEMSVVLEFSRKEWLNHLAAKTPDFEQRLFDLIRKNRDVVAGVCFIHPYTADERAAIDQVSVIGKKLKQEFPGLAYWVSYIEMPYGWKGPLLPIPPEVDVVEMAIYTDMTPEAVQSKCDKYLNTWRRLAGTRPVVLRWVTQTQFDPRKPVNPLRTAPGTLSRCCQLSIQRKLAGVVIQQFGPSEAEVKIPPVESDPLAIRELRDFSTHYGFGRRDKR